MATKSLFKVNSPDGGEAFKIEDTDGTATASVNGTSVSQVHLTAEIEDISTAGQVYIAAPVGGTVATVRTVLNGAIATADATLTVKNDAGSSMGTITVANSGSAAGDKDSLSPSSNNTVTAGDNIEIETDGASTNTVRAFITVTITL